MNRVLRPSLKGMFRIGMVDFYAFLIVAVALIVKAPANVMTPMGTVLAIIFAVSTCITISGMLLNHLYREPESYSILVLQAAFTILLIVGLTA
ncbi:hypothetical protein [Levilactobacillus enshiensis]|uniref:hypothetical protein n=1 Tax=Levilactobacillus enshiensis TaxID=2590213 RepID=UPI00117A07F1|nr:hypothetical protein [Levilactobacillus enshiensis]